MLLSLATTKPVHNTDMLYEMVEATSKIPKLVIVPKVRVIVQYTSYKYIKFFSNIRNYILLWHCFECMFYWQFGIYSLNK